MVVWDRNDYIAEAENHFNNKSVYKNVIFKEKELQDLAETSNNIFISLRGEGKITEKQLKYFTIAHKKATNLTKIYLLPKIHKRLFNVPGRPFISNCGSTTEKVSEILDSHLKGIMQESWSYIKDSNDFIRKTKNLKDILQDALLVTADVVGLYPSTLHEAGLKALKKALDKRENRTIATNDLIRMTKFVLKNNYFEFNGQVKQQIS